MVGSQYLIETDILLEHLNHKGKNNSVLENAMMTGDCFTTVLNASEVYFGVITAEEKIAVDKLFRSLKVLGIHSRYSLSVNDYSDKTDSVRYSLMCVMAKINKLPILTLQKNKYQKSGIKLIDPEELRRK